MYTHLSLLRKCDEFLKLQISLVPLINYFLKVFLSPMLLLR